MRQGSDLKIEVGLSINLQPNAAETLKKELRQILQELGLEDTLKVQ